MHVPYSLGQPGKRSLSGLGRFTHQIAEDLSPSSRAQTGPWEEWVPRALGLTGFADHQAELWEWAWALKRDEPSRPFVAVWSRGHGKSTTAEGVVVALGIRRTIRYALYVSETQRQANDRVGEISDLLGGDYIQAEHTAFSRRKTNTVTGQNKAWRKDRLITQAGLKVDALGLDAAIRGAKIEGDRPDLIILDDIDNESDTPHATEKKIRQITRKVLPTKGAGVKVLAVQNLVLSDGVFAGLADTSPTGADWLRNREVSGPIPAVEGLTLERRYDPRLGRPRHFIVEGTPTWEGMDLAACQEAIDTHGPSAFRREYQHEVEDQGGGLFDHLDYRRCTWDELPELVRVVVAVDPAISSTDDSDCMGIQVDGIAEDDTIYRLFSWEQITSPLDALKRALLKGVELGATTVVVETDQGGDLWRDDYRQAWQMLLDDSDYPQINEGTIRPRYRDEKASRGHGSKNERGLRMLSDYERGRVVHVMGTHLALERALNRAFEHKPFDLADAAYYAWNELRSRSGGNVYRLR